MKILKRSQEIAEALYGQHNHEKSKHWSFAWNKGKLLAVEENTKKTHPKNRFNVRNMPLYQKGRCSELNLALRLRGADWSKITIVNFRIGRDGEIRNSRPCCSCASLIQYLLPRRVYFTNENGEFEYYEHKNH